MSASTPLLRAISAVKLLGQLDAAGSVPFIATRLHRSPLPILRLRSFSSRAAETAAPMGKEIPLTADAGMDAVQRRLMFEDECILVDEHDAVVGHDSKYNCFRKQCIPTPMSASTPLLRAISAVKLLGQLDAAGSVPFIATRLHRSPLPILRLRSFSSRAAETAAPMGKEIPLTADVGMDAVQRRLMFEDECILVDEHDAVVGHDSKYNCHLMEKIESENLLHRAFSVFLFNSNYELLLQQRSATKVTFPLVWTNTCCSHPLYRDSELIEENFLGVRNAAQRKLLDELGIPAEDVPVDEFTPLGRILYKAPSDGKWGEHEVDYLLFIVRDVKLHPNPDEVADVKYVKRDELKELLRKADVGEDGVKLSPWFRLVVDNFLLKWWDHVEKGTLQEVADMKTIHKLI